MDEITNPICSYNNLDLNLKYLLHNDMINEENYENKTRKPNKKFKSEEDKIFFNFIKYTLCM